MWDVAYLIDASSSMQSAHSGKEGGSFVKVAAVKEAVSRALDASLFPEGSRVMVAAYRAKTRLGGVLVKGGETLQVLIPLTEVAALPVRADAEASLSKLELGGATPTGQAVREAIARLVSESGTGTRFRKIVVITDGRPNVGTKEAFRSGKDVARGAVVDAVGIGGVALGTLEAISAPTGGTVTPVDTLEQLAEAVKPGLMLPPPFDPSDLFRMVDATNAEVEEARPGDAIALRAASDKARAVRAQVSREHFEAEGERAELEAKVATLEKSAAEKLRSGEVTMSEFALTIWPKEAALAEARKKEKALAEALGRFRV